MGGVWGVALSGDGRRVASGSQDGHINVWESASGRLVTTLQGHTTQLYGVALSEDTHQVVSAAQEIYASAAVKAAAK